MAPKSEGPVGASTRWPANASTAGAGRTSRTATASGIARAMSDGGEVDLESGFSYETVRALMRKGHSVRFADGPYGGYQAIMVNPQGGYIGASESRKDGQAAGY